MVTVMGGGIKIVEYVVSGQYIDFHVSTLFISVGLFNGYDFSGGESGMVVFCCRFCWSLTLHVGIFVTYLLQFSPGMFENKI